MVDEKELKEKTGKFLDYAMHSMAREITLLMQDAEKSGFGRKV